MIDKFISSPDSFSEHELIEVLLYSVLPRVDTNVLAHRLLIRFGNIKHLLSASPEDLLAVEGIGKKAATQIHLFGKLALSLTTFAKKKPPVIKSFYNNKEEFLQFFTDEKVEKLVLMLLDEKYVKITHVIFTNSRESEVAVELTEIAKVLAINKPTYVIAAHNHPYGNLVPSQADDKFTANLNIICALQGVTLLDHVIVTKTDSISYFINGKLDQIKHTVNVKDIMKNIEEL